MNTGKLTKYTFQTIIICLLPNLTYAHMYPTEYFPVDLFIIIFLTLFLIFLGTASRKLKDIFISKTYYLSILWLILSIGLILFYMVQALLTNDELIVPVSEILLIWVMIFGYFITRLYIIIIGILFFISLIKLYTNSTSKRKKKVGFIFYGITLLVFVSSYLYMTNRNHSPIMGHSQWNSIQINKDFDSIEKALEKYYQIHHLYPKPVVLYSSYSQSTVYQIPNELTTPFAYLNKLPQDPRKVILKETYDYNSGTTRNGKQYYIVTAIGEDMKRNISVELYDPESPEWTKNQLIQWNYDPTNGITSPGDYWRINP